MPPKKVVIVPRKCSTGRPRDTHQTEQKKAWRVASTKRYDKDRQTWNNYVGALQKAKRKKSRSDKAQTEMKKKCQVKKLIKFCSKHIKGFPVISL